MFMFMLSHVDTDQPEHELGTNVALCEIVSFSEIKHTTKGGGLAQWLASRTTDKWVPGSRSGRVAVRCGLEQVSVVKLPFNHFSRVFSFADLNLN